MTKNKQYPLLLQYGMKRSGNHAIAAWLTGKMSCSFVNNLVPIGPILEQGGDYPKAQGFQIWQAQQDGEAPYYVSLEDIELDYEPFSAPPRGTQKILIMRHPDNMFSSRIRKAFNVTMAAYPRENSEIMQRAVRIWKQHARCFLGQDNSAPGRLAIYFDAWLSDMNYRAAICNALGLNPSEDENTIMTDHGGGSSFDGLKFQITPQKMNLQNRADLLNPQEKALLDEIYQDQELTDLKAALALVNPLDHLTSG